MAEIAAISDQAPMSGHFIVCGMGHVGYRCVQLLCRLGERVTVIARETRPEWRREAESCGVRFLTGDVRDEHLLAQAGLESARALIAATDNDIANIETLLDAHNLRPDLPVVVRLFDQTLAQELEASFDVRRALGTSTLAAPTFAAAALGERLAGAFTAEDGYYEVGEPVLGKGSPLAGRTVEEVLRWFGFTVLARTPVSGEPQPAPAPDVLLEAGDTVSLVGRREAWRRLDGAREKRTPAWRALPQQCRRALSPRGRFRAALEVWRDIPGPLRGMLLFMALLIALSFAVFRIGLGLSPLDALTFTVSLLTAGEQGEVTLHNAAPAVKLYVASMMVLGSLTITVVYAIITDLIVTARMQQLLGRRRIPRKDHVIVAGIGNVGFRVIRELRRAGVPVVAVDLDPGGPYIETIRAKVPIVFGDARLHHTLKKAGGEWARAVVAATHDDAVNLGIALAAKDVCSSARAVARLFDAAFAGKVQSAMNVDAAISTSLQAAPAFVAAALYPGVRTAFLLGDTLYTVLQRTAGEGWQGRAPSSLRASGEVIILSRSADAARGNPDAPLEVGERLLAVVWRPIHS